jgi:PucR family transcriptional regulator, purine catabolism regulatory protein
VEDLRPEDVLLLKNEAASQPVLQAAQEGGAAGILLSGAAPFSLDVTSLTLPVVALALEDGDLRSIHRLLLVLLVSQRAGLVERGYHIHRQLAQLAAEGVGLTGLVRAMVEISGRGALVQDKRGYILAAQPSPALFGIWQDILLQLSDLDSLPEALQDRKQAGKKISPFYQEVPGGLVRLVVPVTVGDVARGYLSLVGIPEEMDELDFMVAEQGAVVCAIEMAQRKAVRETEKRLEGDLLTALLYDELSPRDAGLWAQTMGLDLLQSHVALRFAWDKPEAPSRRRLETLIHGEVLRLGLKVILSAMGGEVICFCEIPSTAGRPEAALQLGQAVFEQARSEYPNTLLLCGIGAAVSDLVDWRTSFRQAGQALEMSRRLEARQPLYFPDLSVYRLLFQIEHSPELILFQEEMLGPLLAQENSQDLLRTLESYFAHHGNISQTSEALFIHRNTLIYRLERIATILNQDLENPETRLALQLALHSHRMGTHPSQES